MVSRQPVQYLAVALVCDGRRRHLPYKVAASFPSRYRFSDRDSPIRGVDVQRVTTTSLDCRHMSTAMLHSTT